MNPRLPVLALLAACAGGGPTDSGATADDTGGDTSADVCAEAQPITWEHYGGQILIHDCNGCHAASVSGDARHDAPPDVHFDDATEAWTWSKRILAVATGDAPTMPPAGGVSDDDRVRLEWWFRCGVRGE